MKAIVTESFIKGFGRAIDLSAISSSQILTTKFKGADTENLNGDWKNVGNEIRFATRNYKSGITSR